MHSILLWYTYGIPGMKLPVSPRYLCNFKSDGADSQHFSRQSPGFSAEKRCEHVSAQYSAQYIEVAYLTYYVFFTKAEADQKPLKSLGMTCGWQNSTNFGIGKAWWKSHEH